jgi:hypothetical protein
MEDELGTVGVFHRVWMENIRGYDGGGITFEELGKVCASAIYSPSKKIPLPVFSPEIPIITGAETFPRIFPVQIDRDPANKAGNNFSKVTVTYARVPNIVIPDDVYFWWGRGVVRVSGTRE